LPSDFAEIHFRAYGDWESNSAKNDLLASIRKTADGARVVLNEGDSNEISFDCSLNTWHTFEFYFDLDEDAYDLNMDGGSYEVENEKLISISENIVSFGFTTGNLKDAYNIYIDNYSFDIPSANLIAQNVIWENNFNNVATLSGETKNWNGEKADIDFRADYCYYEVKEGADGKYFYAYPYDKGTMQLGNIYSTGYFMSSALEEFPLNNVRIDMSLKLDNLFGMNLKVYDKTDNQEATVLSFDNTGNIKLGSTAVGTYAAEDWMDISLFIDYTKDTVAVYKDSKYLGCTNSAITPAGFRNLKFNVACSNAVNKTDYGVAIDNIKFSTTHSDDYINRRSYIGCTSNFVDLDFEGLDSITSTEDYTVSGTASLKTEDGNKFFYFSNEVTLSVTPANTQDCYTYTKFGKYPAIVKVEFDIKRTKDWTSTINFGENQLVKFFNANIQFKDGSTFKTGSTLQLNTWATISMYMDFANRKYWAYVDGKRVGSYTIPTGITTPENFNLKNRWFYIDNITISTLPPYGDNAIVEYTDAQLQTKTGYVVNNTGSEVKTYDIYCAKFSSTGVLESVTVTQGTVAAGAMELEELTTQQATDGGYYEYFVWEQNTLKPLVKKLTVR